MTGAVIVITAIGSRDASIAASPNAYLRLTQEQLDQLTQGKPFNLQEWAKACLDIELDNCLRQRAKPEHGSSVEACAAERLEQAERDHPTHFADEHTPADHYYRS